MSTILVNGVANLASYLRKLQETSGQANLTTYIITKRCQVFTSESVKWTKYGYQASCLPLLALFVLS